MQKWEDLKAAERAAAGTAAEDAAERRAAVAAGAAARLRDDRARRHRRLRLGRRRTTSLDKIDEEVARGARARVDRGRRRHGALEDELGDLLFACANFARKLGVEPEAALRAASTKFHRRFTRMEQMARADGTALAALPLDEQNALWDRVKVEAAQASTDAAAR